jgi:hypothetical protein
MQAVWEGPQALHDMDHIPFEPRRRGINASRRSRLYPDRFHLDNCPHKVCIGLSQVKTYPTGPSAGLSLFADCSTDWSVDISHVDPRVLFFTREDVICKVVAPRLAVRRYNDNPGWWPNRYIVWSPDQDCFYDGSHLHHSLSRANDDLAYGYRNAVLFYGPDPENIITVDMWCLVARTYIYSGEEIIYKYAGWRYWRNHICRELALLAWRRCCLDGDESAIQTDVYSEFSWALEHRPDFEFLAYARVASVCASECILSQWVL